MRRRGIDKVIAVLSPSWALERAIARHDLDQVNAYSSSAYSSGEVWSKKRKTSAWNRSPLSNEESATTEYGFDAMRLEAMDLYRNNPLARALVETVRRYARQSKPRAISASILESADATDAEITQATEWDSVATDYFNGYFWPRADALRRPGVTFGTFQDIFVTIQFVQGDMAFVYGTDGWLAVEGIQIRTPSKLLKDDQVKHGFRYNGKGRITHIYVCEYGNYGAIDSNNYTRYPIGSVVFCPWYWRAGQVRGVPRLHGAIDALRDDDEIHEYTKTKVKHESMLLSVERAGSRRRAPGSKITNDDGTETTYEKSDFGMRFKTSGKPGEDFQLAAGQTPHAQYVPLMDHEAMRIAAAVGVPYKILMSLHDGSWSSNKAAQSALRVFVNELWSHRRDTMCQRIYNVTIANAIRNGYLPPAPVLRGVSLFNRAEWTKPFFPQLDQQKEEAGRAAGFQNLTAGMDDWADEQGTTADALFRNHRRYFERLKADAEAVGVPIELYAGSLLAKSSSVSSAPAQSTSSSENVNA